MEYTLVMTDGILLDNDIKTHLHKLPNWGPSRFQKLLSGRKGRPLPINPWLAKPGRSWNKKGKQTGKPGAVVTEKASMLIPTVFQRQIVVPGGDESCTGTASPGNNQHLVLSYPHILLKAELRICRIPKTSFVVGPISSWPKPQDHLDTLSVCLNVLGDQLRFTRVDKHPRRSARSTGKEIPCAANHIHVLLFDIEVH
ncbi:hypothetical protein BDW74DRAFT_143777 [Aspergillus multicolor]|uniref:uncharacterized protein n=1 Tax=Aspergillus multicolor TaxID=41759 RepID=UPI003CCD489A